MLWILKISQTFQRSPILIDPVDDLNFDGKTRWLKVKWDFSIKPSKNGWDRGKTCVGPPPIKTKDGGLIIYRGVGDKCPFYKYKGN